MSRLQTLAVKHSQRVDFFSCDCYGLNSYDFYTINIKVQHSTTRKHFRIDQAQYRVQTIESNRSPLLKEGFFILFFCPRTRPKTFLQCFALEQWESKAKHCRNVLGRKNQIQSRSFRECAIVSHCQSSLHQLFFDLIKTAYIANLRRALKYVCLFNYILVLIFDSILLIAR